MGQLKIPKGRKVVFRNISRAEYLDNFVVVNLIPWTSGFFDTLQTKTFYIFLKALKLIIKRFIKTNRELLL